jgi:hypothetical protein
MIVYKVKVEAIIFLENHSFCEPHLKVETYISNSKFLICREN